MSKFKNSKESVSSSLMLWSDVTTQVGIKEKYEMKVWPVSGDYNEGPINFNIQEQAKALLDDIVIVTKLKLKTNNLISTDRKRDVSVVNNFANSLWGNVDVQFDDRVDITQSMRNAYAYSTYFNTVLNSDSRREDALLYNELFRMDEGKTKNIEEKARTFWKWNNELDEIIKAMMADTVTERDEVLEEVKELLWNFDWRLTQKHITGITNKLGTWNGDEHVDKYNQVREILDKAWQKSTINMGASDRSERINTGKSIEIESKLQCPIISTSKCLPNNMRIRITLTLNTDAFLLLTERNGYSIEIESCHLRVSYVEPHEAFLKQIEQRIQIEPVPYFVSKPEIIVKPITSSGRIIRIHDVFHNKLPSHAFFCLQKSQDFEGSFRTNPFTFVPIESFQFYINGTPYFNDPLEVSTVNNLGDGDYEYKEFGMFLRQLHKVAGVELKGDCLINSKNFALNFITGLSFGADRSDITENHLNIDENGSTSLQIDMGINEPPTDMVLIIYALFNQLIEIDHLRKVNTVE